MILADAFDYFLSTESRNEVAEIGLEVKKILKKVNFDDTNSIDRASNVIRDIMADTMMPKTLSAKIKAEFKKFPLLN